MVLHPVQGIFERNQQNLLLAGFQVFQGIFKVSGEKSNRTPQGLETVDQKGKTRIKMLPNHLKP